MRVELDSRNEKMNAKIRDFTMQKVPYVLVMGDKEAEANAVSVRTRGKGDQGSVPLVDFLARAAVVGGGKVDGTVRRTGNFRCCPKMGRRCAKSLGMGTGVVSRGGCLSL